MVECERIPYMNLADWVVYNLRVYVADMGGDEPTMLAVTLLGDYGWDKILLHRIDGKPVVQQLIDKCIEDPFTRDDEAWTEYMQCVEETLYPVLKQLEPGLRQVMEGMKEALKKIGGEDNG